jgi:microcompartment protein CcmK/EutM
VQIGTVIGHATATVKHASLAGWRLLVVQLLDLAGRPDGDPQLMLDQLGAGVGDRVVACNDGATAQQLVGTRATPARWFVAGICDAGGEKCESPR